jgi:hypothetical protein
MIIGERNTGGVAHPRSDAQRDRKRSHTADVIRGAHGVLLESV